MPAIKFYQNGGSAYMGGNNQFTGPTPRGDIKGWTPDAARRQRNWLWSVNSPELPAYGYAVTLTLRDTPPSAIEWHLLRTRWMERVQYMGIVKIHWVVEWQRRGVPHLHAAVYANTQLTGVQERMLAGHWCVVAGDYGATLAGQDAKPIAGQLGWLRYMAKHAARGADHYQRSGHPAGWEKTGRLWGHAGDWPTIEPETTMVSYPDFYRVRRALDAWAISDARKAGDWKRVKHLRVRRSRPEEKDSRRRGVAEWLSSDWLIPLVEFYQGD
jgi:hypothetical protein